MARDRPHPVSGDVSGAARRQPGRQGAGIRACGRWRRATSGTPPPTGTAASTIPRPAAAPAWCCAPTCWRRRSMPPIADAKDRPRLLMSPRGRPLTQSRVVELAAGPGPADRLRPVRGRRPAGHRGPRPRGSLDRRLRAVRRRNRRHGADRRLRAAVAGRDGKTGLRRGRELFRWTTGIPAIYPPAGVRGPRRSRKSSLPATTPGSRPGGRPRPRP